MRTFIIAALIALFPALAALANPSPSWEARCEAAAKGESVLVNDAEFDSAFVTTNTFQVENAGTFRVCGKVFEGEYEKGLMTLPDGKVIPFRRSVETRFQFGGWNWKIALDGRPIPDGKIGKETKETKVAQAAKAPANNRNLSGMPSLGL